jgi:PiT family inorganic phosphate transporter
MSVGALAADNPPEDPPAIGEESREDIPSAADLFDPATTGRVLAMQNVVPVLATAGAYGTFLALYAFWW